MKKLYIFMIVLIAISISGCKVTVEEMDFANSVCLNEGGLKYYDTRGTFKIHSFLGDAYCTNGVVVYGEIFKKNDKARKRYPNLQKDK